MDTSPKEKIVVEPKSSGAEIPSWAPEFEKPSETVGASGPESARLLTSSGISTAAAEKGVAETDLPVKSQLEKEIGDVLAEDLENLYWELPETERLIFKYKGEETASKIRLLLGEASVKVQEIFRLIVEWLKLLPGVSNFFIEQEAKIKTDKLMKFHG